MFTPHGADEARHSTQQLIQEMMAMMVQLLAAVSSRVVSTVGTALNREQENAEVSSYETNLGELVLAAKAAQEANEKEKANALYKKIKGVVEEQLKDEPKEIQEKLKSAKLSEQLDYLNKKNKGLHNIRATVSSKELGKAFNRVGFDKEIKDLANSIKAQHQRSEQGKQFQQLQRQDARVRSRAPIRKQRSPEVARER